MHGISKVAKMWGILHNSEFDLDLILLQESVTYACSVKVKGLITGRG